MAEIKDWEDVPSEINDWVDVKPAKQPSSPIPKWDPLLETVSGGTLSDTMGSITHNIPLAGIAQKAGSAAAAGFARITPDAVLKPEFQGKSFTELYKMNQDKVAADQAAREERSPIASTVLSER